MSCIKILSIEFSGFMTLATLLDMSYVLRKYDETYFYIFLRYHVKCVLKDMLKVLNYC
jgi:hypothetical protein